jgi:hypothetical protein
MLVTRERHSWLNKYLNIFYKHEKYLEFMDITKPTVLKSQELSELNFANEYLNFLTRQELDDKDDHVGERYTFVNLTVSLLEVLMKKRIEYHIESNWNNYESTWRTLSLQPKFPKYIIKSISEPSQISHAISHSFSYQSLDALNYFLNNLSLIENFFDYHIEKISSKKPQINKKLIEVLIDLRNESTHELKDYKLSKKREIQQIKFDLKNVIIDMLNTITASFDTRNILFKKTITDKSDKEKLCKQKERMNKIKSTFKDRYCKYCRWNDGCKYCIKIPRGYYWDENKLIKKELANQLKKIGELMKGL